MELLTILKGSRVIGIAKGQQCMVVGVRWHAGANAYEVRVATGGATRTLWAHRRWKNRSEFNLGDGSGTSHVRVSCGRTVGRMALPQVMDMVCVDVVALSGDRVHVGDVRTMLMAAWLRGMCVVEIRRGTGGGLRYPLHRVVPGIDDGEYSSDLDPLPAHEPLEVSAYDGDNLLVGRLCVDPEIRAWTGGSAVPPGLANDDSVIGRSFRRVRSSLFREQVSTFVNSWKFWPDLGTARIFWNRARLDAWASLRAPGGDGT